MNKDKFAKTIDDEQLDEVAGGTKAETQKDIKFLNAIGKDLGIKLDKNATPDQVSDAWIDVGITAILSLDKNAYGVISVNSKDRRIESVNFSRQDAMIEAMRKTKTFVDLDEYL